MAAKMLKPGSALKIIIFHCGLPLVRALRRAIRQKCYSIVDFLFSRRQWPAVELNVFRATQPGEARIGEKHLLTFGDFSFNSLQTLRLCRRVGNAAVLCSFSPGRPTRKSVVCWSP